MIKLAPSILSADFARLGDALALIKASGAHYAHIDVMDGHFVPNITIGIPMIKSLRPVSNLIFDVHLMISEPERYVEDFIKAGADIICFHVETAKDPEELIKRITAMGKAPAIAIKPSTPIETAFQYVKDLSMVLIMSVEPGFGGQAFMPEALNKARYLRNYIDATAINCRIEMDGGINTDNLRSVIDAGVDVVVAGSDIFGADNVAQRINQYLSIFSEKK